jgi:hypothetical protein
LLSLAWLAGTADAEDKNAKYYQKQFEQWSKAIADLKQGDPSGVTAQEIEVIRTLISQAQAFLASDKLDAIEPLLRRIEAQAEFVRAKLDRTQADDTARIAEEAAAAAEKQAQEATAAADAAEAKVKSLEAQGL